MSEEEGRTAVQKALDEIRERVADAYETQDLSLTAQMALDDILDQMEDEGWK